MMTLQSRELLVPHANPGQPLRTYPANSPRAKARLLALAMLADGRLDDSELESLSKNGIFQRIGISREDFFEVLYDFCADLENLPRGSDDYLLSPIILNQLFDEVDSSSERQVVLRQIFDMIRCDGHLSDSETDVFWHAVDAWNFQATDTQMALHRYQLHQQGRRSATPSS